jgi:hypothetical protein
MFGNVFGLAWGYNLKLPKYPLGKEGDSLALFSTNTKHEDTAFASAIQKIRRLSLVPVKIIISLPCFNWIRKVATNGNGKK